MRNYLSEMLYALTSAYTRKDYNNRRRDLPIETNIGKLFAILAWGLDSVEKQTELIKLWEDIDYAEGAVLDRYGANFGVARISPDDRFYRMAIKVKLMAQLSGGDINTVIEAASALLEVDVSEVMLDEVYPAKIELFVDQKLLSPERIEMLDLIAEAIKRILAAGVGLRLYLRTHSTYRHEIVVRHCGYAATEQSAPPFTKDRDARMTLKTLYGAFQPTEVSAARPPQNRAHTATQEGAGGAVCHTRIKSKRVDKEE